MSSAICPKTGRECFTDFICRNGCREPSPVKPAQAPQPAKKSSLTPEQLADMVPVTATILEGEPKKVCMTRKELMAFANAAVAAGRAQQAKDTQRLTWLIQHDAFISFSRDGENCNVWILSDRDGEPKRPFEGYPQKRYDDPREAIDACIAAQQKGESK